VLASVVLDVVLDVVVLAVVASVVVSVVASPVVSVVAVVVVAPLVVSAVEVVGSPPVLPGPVVTGSAVDPEVDPEAAPVSLPAPLSSVDPAPPGVQAYRRSAATEIMEWRMNTRGVLARPPRRAKPMRVLDRAARRAQHRVTQPAGSPRGALSCPRRRWPAATNPPSTSRSASP
jgi:hypothetical protein